MLSIKAGSNFAARIVIEGIAAGTALSDALLRNPESSFMAKGPGCVAIVETPLCGNCTDIYDNTVGILLPLATAPLRRNEGRMEIVLHLADDDEDCRFKIDCGTMRQALDWATARPDARATERDNKQCASAEGYFITTACCEVLGLGYDCFELRILRRYRDPFLATRPGGAAAIARCYALAPHPLALAPGKRKGPPQGPTGYLCPLRAARGPRGALRPRSQSLSPRPADADGPVASVPRVVFHGVAARAGALSPENQTPVSLSGTHAPFRALGL